MPIKRDIIRKKELNAAYNTITGDFVINYNK